MGVERTLLISSVRSVRIVRVVIFIASLVI